MAKSGWLLVGLNGWLFEFEGVKSCDKKFFIYSGFDASRGISFDYYLAKEKYSKKSSRLNKKSSWVFEVDSLKIDEQFFQYLNLRNSYYMNFYIKLLLFNLILSGVCVPLFSCMNYWYICFMIPLLISVYSIFARLVLKRYQS